MFFNNGNVGIGTTDPIVKLNIVGNYEDGQERALIRLKNMATGNKASVSLALQAYDDKGMSLAYTSPDYGLNDLADFGIITTNGRGFAIAPNQGQIRFYTNRNSDGSYSEKMRIDENGNVGIGTSSPTRKLQIETNSDYRDYSRDLILLRNLSSGTHAYTGINLRSDDYNYGLGISFTSSNYSAIEDMKSSASINTNGKSLSISTSSENGSIRFLSNPYQSGLIEMMRLDVNGKLGLGTKTPHAKLEIADGDVYIDNCNNGIIMKSPNGQCWRGNINDEGVLEFVSVPCPSE
jgi:hypothetical protein